MRRIIAFALALLLFAGAAPARAEAVKQSAVGYYLDTVITLTCWVEDPAVLDEALEECGRYEALLSRTKEGSDVWRINHAEGQPVTVSDDTIRVLEEARSVSELSGGLFDVTIGQVTVLWDFRSGEAVLPDAEELARAAALCDWRQVQIDGNTVTVPAGCMIDLGGIAKGYIADAVRQFLKDRGVTRGILSFGGNIVTIGTKEGGAPWKIGLQDIDGQPGESMGRIACAREASFVTSGIYERGFEVDGVFYHHILDPATGWPVQNELAAVTVITTESIRGDALSTALFALGLDRGLALAEELPDTEAVFITRNRQFRWTSGAEGMVEIN